MAIGLFFSFLPGMGDVIAADPAIFVAEWWIVALSMLLGKFVRYIVWMYLNGLIMWFLRFILSELHGFSGVYS